MASAGSFARGEKGGGSSEVLRCGKDGDVVVVVREFVEGPLPAVAFVLDEALQHGEGGGLAAFGTKRYVAKEWRDAWEVCGFGEEAADLGVGIFAGLQAAEEFEDELGVVEDRGVGLLRGAGAGRQQIGAASFGEGAAAAADESAVAGGQLCVLFDELEDGLTDIFARDRVVQDGGAAGGGDGGEDAGGVGGADGFCSLAGGDGEGKLIDAGAVVIVGELEEDKRGVEAGELRGVEDCDGFDDAGFGSEPALMREVG